MITVDNAKKLPANLAGRWVSVTERVPPRAAYYFCRRSDCAPFVCEFHAERFMVSVVEHWFEPSPVVDHMDAEERALALLVDGFAEAMKAKLIAKYRKAGYGGWDNEVNACNISSSLAKHVSKGDPVDIANLAAFLWNFQQP